MENLRDAKFENIAWISSGSPCSAASPEDLFVIRCIIKVPHQYCPQTEYGSLVGLRCSRKSNDINPSKYSIGCPPSQTVEHKTLDTIIMFAPTRNHSPVLLLTSPVLLANLAAGGARRSHFMASLTQDSEMVCSGWCPNNCVGRSSGHVTRHSTSSDTTPSRSPKSFDFSRQDLLDGDDRPCDDQSESGSDEPESEFDGKQEPESEFDEQEPESFWGSVVTDLLKTYKFDASEGSWVDLQHLNTGTSPGVKVADLPQALTLLKKKYPDRLMGRRRDIPRPIPMSDTGDSEVLSMSKQQQLVHLLYRHDEHTVPFSSRKNTDEPRADYSLEEVLDHLLGPVTEIQMRFHGWITYEPPDGPHRQAAFRRRLTKLYALRLRLLQFSEKTAFWNPPTLANFDRELNHVQDEQVKKLLMATRSEFERRWARTDEPLVVDATVMWSEKQVRAKIGRAMSYVGGCPVSYEH